MAFETTKFTANSNKTVTVSGMTFQVIPSIPEGVKIYLNDVLLEDGVPVDITQDMHLTADVASSDPTTIKLDVSDYSTLEFDGEPVTSTATLNVSDPGAHTLKVVGATAIPQVTIGGAGIAEFSVNGQGHTTDQLPYTFTPIGGTVNQVFVTGTNLDNYRIQMMGTDIETVEINGKTVQLPYTATVTDDLKIAVAGEIYQLDLASTPGATIVDAETGTVLSDGKTRYHKMLDVDRDMYLAIDGTHQLVVTGEDIQYITVNGVKYPIDSLPATINNTQMQAVVNITGYEPSEVHVAGQYIDTITVDGKTVPIGDAGGVDVEITARGENHYINVIGSQPREYALTYNNHGTTTIQQDGSTVNNGVGYLISKDTFIESTPLAVPVHIETDPTIVVQVNGREYTGNDISINVSQATELDISAEVCSLTIDYGDNSYTIIVPQQVITICAVHRDGWVFDTWGSSNVGIMSPKQVQTQIDLRGKTSANVVCHYQRCYTMDKPNHWN